MLERARDLGLEAAAAASASLAETSKELKPQEVVNLLNSKFDRDILNGLKHITSVMYSGEDASRYFTDVVKNVTSSNLSIRKLVYAYLLRYAEEDNDVALLSVNAIQKSLGDKNEQVRALAVRVMSEIRISSIYQIVILGIKKCVSDPSPVVRKAAAISLVKVFNNYGESSKSDIAGFVEKLMKDNSASVWGSTILAFRTICPESYDLLHGHFHHLCAMMANFDEWTQIHVVEVLTNYTRLYLPKPKIINTASIEHTFIVLPDNYNEIPFPVYDVELDSDLKTFLDCIRPLVYSKNEAVVLAVGRAFFHLTPPKTFKEAQVAASLVRCLLTSPLESRVFVLQSILYMAIHDPTIFVQYEKRFYLLPNDDFHTADFKLKVLSSICNENNIKTIINELQYYALHAEDFKISVESVKAIGICSQISDYWSLKTLKWLLKEVSVPNKNSAIVTELLTVIRYLVQQNPRNNVKTVAKLAHLLDDQSLSDGAKESIIWLVGEFSEIEPNIGPDVLRKLLKTFSMQTDNVRYQTIVLASKMYSHTLEDYKNSSGDSELEHFNYDDIIPKMFRHVIRLGRYDDIYDIRDRSRTFHSLLNTKHTQLATLFLQAPKPVPLVSLKRSEDSLSKKDDSIDSLPIDDIVKNYNKLLSWSDPNTLPPSSIRVPIEVKDVVKSIGRGVISPEQTMQSNFAPSPPPLVEKKYKLQSLDDFFADDEPELPGHNARRVIYQEESENEEETDDTDDTDETGDSERSEDESEEEGEGDVDNEDDDDVDAEIHNDN